MDITFLVPCKDLAGGLKVVAAHANGLLRRGHNVRVVYPHRELHWKENLRRQVKRKMNDEKDHLDYFKGELIEVDEITQETVPKGDAIIATAWQTAEWIKDYPESYGKKFYLIQHYETWSGEQEQVDKTFQYPFQKIVISKWLQDVVGEVCGDKNLPLIPNGKDFFFSESYGEGIERSFDVGMLYSRVKFKKSIDGIKALQIVKQKKPNLKVVFFGSEFPKEEVFDDLTFYRRPPQDKIRDIYLSSRVWISSSETEGFCLPALESISLGCSFVGTDSLGIRDIIESGKSGILVEPCKPKLLAEKIIEVLENPELEKSLRVEGLKKSDDFSWNKSSDLFEQLLLDK